MVEIAFFIALALGLLKLSEMALRPHQKKWLQQKMETLTLSADYRTNGYRNWLSLLRRTTKFQINWAALIVFILSVSLITSEINWQVKTGLIGLLIALCLGLAAWMWHRAPEFLDWAQVDQMSIRSVVRVFGVASLVILANLLRFVPDKYVEDLPLLLILPLILASIGVLVYFLWNPGRWIKWNIFSTLVFPVAFALAIWIATAALCRASVGVLWRIVEYPSGAWAAILFLLTGVLGIAKLYLG